MHQFLAYRAPSVFLLIAAMGCSPSPSSVVAGRDAGNLRAAIDSAVGNDAGIGRPTSDAVIADSGVSLDADSTGGNRDAGHASTPNTVKATGSAFRDGAASNDDDAGAVPTSPLCTVCGACEEAQPVVSAMHTTMTVTYADLPPSSGPHNPCWASWGIHEDAPVPAERWVHNLEHGGIVYLYNCQEACDTERAVLAKIVAERGHAVLTAYPQLRARFAAVSWGRRLVSDCMDEQTFEAFYELNAEHGPESNMSPPNPMCPP